MRTVLLLAATAVAVSACTTAQGATGPASGPAAPVSTPAATAPAPGTASPMPSPSTPLPPASVLPNPSASPSASVSASPTPSSVVDPAMVGAPAPIGALVLGDSISLGIADDLSRYGYPVIGLVGQSANSTYLRTHLSTPLAQSAPTWVIVLGTNNSGSPDDVAMLDDLVEVIDGLRTPGAKQQVRWVTPHRPTAYVGTKTAYTLDAFNAELSRLSSEHRWLRILDFDVLAKANPDWFDADTAMHLHPDSRGQDALVALITGPAPRPADSPAPVLDGSWSVASDEPETFDNSTLPPTAPSPEPLPDPSGAAGSDAAAGPTGDPTADPAGSAEPTPTP